MDFQFQSTTAEQKQKRLKLLCSLSNTTSLGVCGIFESHEEIAELKEGCLHTMNKPGKARIVENTRPIVFLSITRKALSSVAPRRVSDKTDKLLSLSQHAYRARRSATKIAMTMTTQWLSATSEKYAERIHIMGVDALTCLSLKSKQSRLVLTKS